MRLNKIVIFIICSVLCSCSNLVGTYYWGGNKIGPDAFKLSVKENNRFSFQTWSDILGSDTIHGTWTMKDDMLFLASDVKSNIDLINVKSSWVDSLSKSGSYLISLLNTDGDYLLGSEIIFNNSYKIILLEETYFWIQIIPKTLDINYVNWNLEIDNLDYEKYNVFEIFIDLKSVKLNNFNLHSKWLKKGNRLIQIDDKGKIIEGGTYKKKF
jgi:hypothetical protein